MPLNKNIKKVLVIGSDPIVINQSVEFDYADTSACRGLPFASAVAAVLNGHSDKGEDIKVQLLGGELIINYTYDTVYMTGDCKKVFDGMVEL